MSNKELEIEAYSSRKGILKVAIPAIVSNGMLKIN